MVTEGDNMVSVIVVVVIVVGAGWVVWDFGGVGRRRASYLHQRRIAQRP
jgi:hypothetical protein